MFHNVMSKIAKLKSTTVNTCALNTVNLTLLTCAIAKTLTVFLSQQIHFFCCFFRFLNTYVNTIVSYKIYKHKIKVTGVNNGSHKPCILRVNPN